MFKLSDFSFAVAHFIKKVVKGHKNHSYVVSWSSQSSGLKNGVYRTTTQPMIIFLPVGQFLTFFVILLINHFLPDRVNTVLILKFIEDTVATKHKEVMFIRLNLKLTDIWLGYHHIGISQ